MHYSGIFFDFFGVICSEVAPVWLARHLPAEQALELKSRVIGAADRGDLSQEEMFASLASQTGVPAGRIEKEWYECAQIDSRVVSLVESLASRYKLGLLTNAPAPFFRHIFDGHNLGRLFDAVVVSSEHDCAKPDARIYEIALAQLGLPAGVVLMVDDNAANIAGARSAGMLGLLFCSAEQLENALTLGTGLSDNR